MKDDNITKSLFFLRHGQTDANVQELMCGCNWDIDLNDYGHEQARSAASDPAILSRNIQVIFSSPMKRAQQTAHYFSTILKIPVTIQEDLREWDIGDWDKMPYREIEGAFIRNEDPPNGEKIERFNQRILTVISGIYHANQTALIVSHGAVWKQICGLYSREYRPAENCKLYELREARG